MDIKDYLSVTGILIDVPIGDKTRPLKELSTHVGRRPDWAQPSWPPKS